MIKLDDSRWHDLDRADKASHIPDLIGAIAKLPDWNAPSERFTATVDPWDRLQAAIFDEGNVRASAYAVIPHLMTLAESRSARDRTVLLHFILMVVFDVLEGAASIPLALIGDLERAMTTSMHPIAEACVLDATIRDGSRKVASAAVVLAEKDLVAARVGYNASSAESLELECTSCSSKIVIEWDGMSWSVCELGSPLIREDSGKRLERLAAIARPCDHDGQFRALVEIDALIQCVRCGQRLRLLEIVAADLRARCPLAHIPGWQPM